MLFSLKPQPPVVLYCTTLDVASIHPLVMSFKALQRSLIGLERNIDLDTIGE